MPTNGDRRLPAAVPASEEPGVLLGDLTALAAQIGSTDALSSLAASGSALRLGNIRGLLTLREFLQRYHQQVLVPLELPAIHDAYWHACRYEIRELIELDRRLAGEPRLAGFAAASRRVGWAQLRRLRPLRDQRLVQRYVGAVEAGQTQGWHTVVYGLVLAVYSLPLRQGLLNYGLQTTRGFIAAAGRSLRFSQAEAEQLVFDLSAGLPPAVEGLLGGTGPGALVRI